MRRLYIPALVVLMTGLYGCQTTKPEPAEVNGAIVQSFGDMAIENAILRQQTLYAYHFEADGPEPNELGCRELALLGSHYKQRAGMLRVRQGDASTELYQARIDRVRELLSKQGVPPENVSITDGLPGGNGMPSEDVMKITTGRNSPSMPLYNLDGNGSGSNSAESGMGEASNGGGRGPMQ
jgi:hypothetical protein